MKILLDTNIVLDLLLERKPHVHSAEKIFGSIEKGEHQGMLCATTITTLDYLLSQSMARKESRKTLSQLLRLFEIAPVNRTVILEALQSTMTDFEDAVLDQSAALSGAEAIITQNSKDFSRSIVPVFDPQEFLNRG